jgi:hypothetical protein
MQNKIIICINICFLIFLGVIFVLFIINYSRYNEVQIKLNYYEKFNAEDTIGILKTIIKKEILLGRLKADSRNRILIQYYPYIGYPYKIPGIDSNDIYYASDPYNFETRKNRFNFINFSIHPDNSSDIVYFIGSQKVHARLEKHRSWEITKFINYQKSN